MGSTNVCRSSIDDLYSSETPDAVADRQALAKFLERYPYAKPPELQTPEAQLLHTIRVRLLREFPRQTLNTALVDENVASLRQRFYEILSLLRDGDLLVAYRQMVGHPSVAEDYIAGVHGGETKELITGKIFSPETQLRLANGDVYRTMALDFAAHAEGITPEAQRILVSRDETKFDALVNPAVNDEQVLLDVLPRLDGIHKAALGFYRDNLPTSVTIDPMIACAARAKSDPQGQLDVIDMLKGVSKRDFCIWLISPSIVTDERVAFKIIETLKITSERFDTEVWLKNFNAEAQARLRAACPNP